jgi:hypothetical protein
VDPNGFNPDPAFLLNPYPDPTLKFLPIASLQLSILQKLFQQNFALVMIFLAETLATLKGHFHEIFYPLFFVKLYLWVP